MKLLCILLLLPLSVISQQTTWNVNQYPDPWWEYNRCGRSHRSSVCDPDLILSEEKADEIDRVIQEVKNETRCLCYDCVQDKRGYLIRVALMDQMQKIYNSSMTGPSRDLKEAHMYSYLLSQKWKFEGSCNETILILYSRKDNVVYTLTRQHARLKLRDNDVVKVSVDTGYYFDDKETIGDGIIAMIKGFKSFLKGDEYKPYHAEENDADNTGTTISISSFILYSHLLVILVNVVF